MLKRSKLAVLLRVTYTAATESAVASDPVIIDAKVLKAGEGRA